MATTPISGVIIPIYDDRFLGIVGGPHVVKDGSQRFSKGNFRHGFVGGVPLGIHGPIANERLHTLCQCSTATVIHLAVVKGEFTRFLC